MEAFAVVFFFLFLMCISVRSSRVRQKGGLERVMRDR